MYCSPPINPSKIFAGYIPVKIREIYALVLKNQIQALKEMYDGANAKIAARNVKNDFKLHNYDLVHSLGHGVGLDIHETPFISDIRDWTLKENMVVTDEPGIYLTGTYGVRIEDTVLITKSGCITLTKSDKNYIIVDEQDITQIKEIQQEENA